MDRAIMFITIGELEIMQQTVTALQRDALILLSIIYISNNMAFEMCFVFFLHNYAFVSPQFCHNVFYRTVLPFYGNANIVRPRNNKHPAQEKHVESLKITSIIL